MYSVKSQGITWNYYSPASSHRIISLPETKWKGESWSKCSATCAGGIFVFALILLKKSCQKEECI